MAKLRVGAGGLNMATLAYADGTTSGDDDRARITFDAGDYLVLDGSGFTYAGGELSGGTVMRLTNVVDGALQFRVTDVSLDASVLGAIVDARDAGALSAYVFGGNDTLRGSDVNDTLAGFDGDDRIDGGAGIDVLVGGLGADRLTGGAGADAFVYQTIADSTVERDGRDRIIDFDGSAFDRINLRAIDANVTNDANGAQNDAFAFVTEAQGLPGELTITQVTGGYFVAGDIDGGGADFAIFVQSAQPLTANDILL